MEHNEHKNKPENLSFKGMGFGKEGSADNIQAKSDDATTNELSIKSVMNSKSGNLQSGMMASEDQPQKNKVSTIWYQKYKPLIDGVMKSNVQQGRNQFKMPAVFKNGGIASGMSVIRSVSLEKIVEYIDINKVFLGMKRRVGTLAILTMAFIALSGGAGLLLNKYSTDTYKAKTLLLHSKKKANSDALYNQRNYSLETVIEMIDMPENCSRVKAILGLDLTVAELTELTEVSTSRKTNFITLEVAARNPDLATNIANTLAEVAVESNRSMYKQTADNAYRHFYAQAGSARTKLAVVNKEISEFRKTHELLDVETENRVILETYSKMQLLYNEAKIVHEGLVIEYDNLKAELELLPNEVVRQAYEDNPMKSRITHTQGLLLDARTKYGPGNPKVARLEDELKELRNLLSEGDFEKTIEKVYERNPLKETLALELSQLTRQIKSAKNKTVQYQAAIVEYSKNFSSAPGEQLAYNELLRKRESAESEFEAFDKAAKAAKISALDREGDFDVYQPASSALLHSGLPISILITCGGSVLGIIFALGLTLSLELMDRKIRTKKQLNLWYTAPVLAGIAQLDNSSPEVIGEQLLPDIRLLSERILQTADNRSMKSIMLTSSLVGEGKSIIAFNLARYFSSIGVRTAYIDWDSDTNSLCSDVEYTVNDYLAGDADFDSIINDCQPAVLQADDDGSMKELIKSYRFLNFLDTLNERFDLVIHDAPGVLTSNYTANLAQTVDSCLYLINSDKASKVYVDSGIHQLEENGVIINGMILNGVLPQYEGKKLK